MHTKYLLLSLAFLASLLSSAAPTCALDYPCPPPSWTPQWQLNLSTVCQPGNTQGYFLPPQDKPWGLVSLDWSNARSLWLNDNRNRSTCEATNTQNAKLIKQTSTGTRVFIYHNMELALQWLESQRAVMYDPDKANWFLQYTDGNGHKNGTIYNEPREEGDQYFWDFRVQDAANYYVTSVLKTATNPYVDGSFADDVDGIPNEHPDAVQRMKLTSQEITDIRYATQATSQLLINALVKSGKYLWQAFSAGDDVGPGPSQKTCADFMKRYCTVLMQSNPMTMKHSSQYATQSVAAFLITRPPYGWLGFGWESDMKNWDSLFNLDVGVPVGLCKENPTGVFSRDWSKGKAVLDCNTWTAQLNFPK